jgi:hypothetical protein
METIKPSNVFTFPSHTTVDKAPSLAAKYPSPQDPHMADEITELRTQLAEAKTDKKFSDMLGEVRSGFAEINGKIGALDGRLSGSISALEARLSSLESQTSGIKTTVIVTGLAIAGLMIGVLTYGQAWFGIGVSTRDVVKSAVTEYIEEHPAPSPKP